MSRTPEEMHSRRYVTSGYKNALHRVYLYGLGLTDRDMQQPFVGIAQCFHDARPEYRSLVTAFDRAKDAVARAAMTSRHFLVPVAAKPTEGADSIMMREMAADSAEIVVRGHWYDVLVGVAATPASMFGVAQAIARLRIPGVVVVPEDVVQDDPDVRAALELLQALGLGCVAGRDDDALAATMQQLHDEIAGTARVASLGDDLRAGALSGREIPDALWPDLCAVAYEAGVATVADLGVSAPSGLAAETAAVAGIEHPGPVDSPLNYDAL